MKTHISKMQINNNEGKRDKYSEESDEEENQNDTCKLESDEDEYFVGDEINFQIAGRGETKS